VPAPQPDLLQGTLDLLVLKALSLGPMHGYGILLRIQHFSRTALEIQQGSLYPAIYRLEHRGLIAGAWGASENNRRAKFYNLTPAGKRQFQQEKESWSRMVRAVTNILAATPADLEA
jgi:transcriptional regulator